MGEMLETTIEVKLDKVPNGFDIGERVLGESDENMTYIKNETDATIQTLLKGPTRSTIDMIIRHKDMDGLKKTEDLIHSLIATVKEDYQDFLSEQPPFIRSRYKADDLKCTQTYSCRPKCDMTFENLQTYTHHLSSKWHLVNTSRNVSKAEPKGPAPGQGERKEFVGTVTNVKGHFVVISDSIICDTRILPGQVKFQVGDRVKGIQVPATHPNYKWKAVSVNMLSINKNPTSLLGNAPAAPALTRNTRRKELFEQQLLKAFSFFLNEQTTPRALWNTHHMVQSQAKTRPFQRPHMMQSPTFCALCNMNVVSAAMMPGHLQSASHRIKYVEKQLELGLERFPVMYGTVPLPGVVTNNGKRLAVDALVLFFSTDLPSHNADAFKSMILLNGALKNLYCEICQQSLVRYDVWIQHMVGKQHATKCVQVMATRGLRAYLQQYPAVPAPAPRKMKEAIKVMAEHLLKNAHQLQEYAIETETVPELDSLPDQPATQGNKPGLLGDAPLGLAPSSFEGGPDPLSDIIGVGNKRKKQGDNFHSQKKAKAGLLGSAPVGFEILDESGDWEGGYAEETSGKEEWVGPAHEEWDAPPGFKLEGKGKSGPLTAWDLPDEEDGGEYVGGFSSGNGTNMMGRRGGNQSAGKLAAMRTRLGNAPPSLLDIDTGREWDNPERGEFVGGGGDDSFVGGGDPNFLPPGVTRDNAANILQAAQSLMKTVPSPVGSMGGPSPQRGPQPGVSQPEMVALQALSNNIRSLVNTLQTRQAMHPQMLMSRLTPQDLQFLREVRNRTGIENIPLLIRLVQTVRSLPANVFYTLSKLNPAVLLSNLAGSSPQQKMIVKQIMTLLGAQTLEMQPNMMQRGGSNFRPGLLGEHPMVIMRRQLSGGGAGVPSLLDMPVTFRG